MLYVTFTCVLLSQPIFFYRNLFKVISNAQPLVYTLLVYRYYLGMSHFYLTGNEYGLCSVRKVRQDHALGKAMVIWNEGKLY